MESITNPWIVTIIGGATAAILAGLLLKFLTRKSVKNKEDIENSVQEPKGPLAGAIFFDQAGRGATFMGRAAPYVSG